MFTPLREAGVKPGDRVGVVGIGGLGHLAIQFAKAMGATPVAFSRSANKEAEVRALGAEVFVNTNDAEQAAKAAGSVDVLLITADANDMPYNQYLGFLRKRGTCIMLAAPEDDVRFKPLFLIGKGVKFLGSAAGGISDIKAILQLASEKNVSRSCPCRRRIRVSPCCAMDLCATASCWRTKMRRIIIRSLQSLTRFHWFQSHCCTKLGASIGDNITCQSNSILLRQAIDSQRTNCPAGSASVGSGACTGSLCFRRLLWGSR